MTNNQQLKQDELFAHIDEALKLPRLTPEQLAERERVAAINHELWGDTRSELEVAFDNEWVVWNDDDLLVVTNVGVKAGFGLRA